MPDLKLIETAARLRQLNADLAGIKSQVTQFGIKPGSPYDELSTAGGLIMNVSCKLQNLGVR